MRLLKIALLGIVLALGLLPASAYADTPSGEEDALALMDTHSAQAASLTEGLYTFANEQSQKMIYIVEGSTENGANVCQLQDNNSMAQRFRAVTAGDGWYYLVNINSGKVLDVENGQSFPGTNIQQYQQNSSDAQKWKFVSADDSSYYIVSALSPNPDVLEGSYVIDVDYGSTDDGANLQIYTYNGSGAQRFEARPVQRSIADGFYTISSALATGKGLDIEGGSTADGGNVQLYSFNDTAAQRFSVKYDESCGYYTITNVLSGKVIDLMGASQLDGTEIQQFTPNSTSAQKWSIDLLSDGTYCIRSGCSGKVLDVTNGHIADGTNIQAYTFNDTAAQKWSFHEVQARTVADGYYTVTSGLSSSLVLDICAGSIDSGANAQVYTSNSTMAQKFQLIYDSSSGYYVFVAAVSGKLLDVRDGSVTSGANVWQYTSNGTPAQWWSIEDNGTGSYTIRSAKSGKVLDVAGGSILPGTNVQQYSSNGTAAQKWLFKEVPLIEDGIYAIQSALGTVLDAQNGATLSGTNIQTYSPNDTFAQKYQLNYVSEGYYTIENIASGFVVSVPSTSDTNVQLSAEDRSDLQLWEPGVCDGGYVRFTNKGTGKVLDVAYASAEPGANVQVYSSNGSIAQQWRLVDTDTFVPGTYTISSALDTSFVLDITNGSLDNGALLQLYGSNGTAAQKFQVVGLGDDTYRIVCLGSNKSLDVKDSAIDALSGGGTVQQWETKSGNLAQTWRFAYAGDGCFNVFSVLGDGTSCLDIVDGVIADGTSVRVWKKNGADAQRFKFMPAGSIVYQDYGISLAAMTDLQYAGYSASGSSTSWDTLYAALDPSNSSGGYYYQFVDLRIFTGLTGSQLDTYISSTTKGANGVLAGHGSAFAAAAKEYGLNEAYLTAHSILESGWGTSTYASGTYYDGEKYTIGSTTYYLYGYQPGVYYNLFGWGAYDSNPDYCIQYAIEHGWNSVDAAIYGVAELVANNYIYRSSYPQPTLYDMKWNTSEIVTKNTYIGHEYATSALWAKSIGSLVKNCYTAAGITDPDLTFLVPRYAS